jgi:hypothetical protein
MSLDPFRDIWALSVADLQYVRINRGTSRKKDGETNTRLPSACDLVGHLCRSQRSLVTNESGLAT